MDDLFIFFPCHDSVILRRISPGLLLFRKKLRNRQVSQDAIRLGGSVPWLFSYREMVRSPRKMRGFKGTIGVRLLRDVVSFGGWWGVSLRKLQDHFLSYTFRRRRDMVDHKTTGVCVVCLVLFASFF